MPSSHRTACGALIVGSMLTTLAWSLRYFRRPAFSALGSVTQVGAMKAGFEQWPLSLGLVVALVWLLVRRPALARFSVAGTVTVVSLAAIGASVAAPIGRYALILYWGVAMATLASFLPVPVLPGSDRKIAGGLWGLATLQGAAFSMHRHWSMGSGSWDLGCMVHNLYLASRFMPTTSTVLSDVDFIGDHFMPGIYLYAPLYWLNASAYMMLLIQAINVTASAPAIYLIARHKGAAKLPAAALGLAVGLAFGTTSATFYDAHAITIGFGFLAFALYAIEVERFVLASVLLGIFALFKESLGPYVAALGLLMLWRGFVGKDRRKLKFGTAWAVAGGAWFLLTMLVLKPWFASRGNAPPATSNAVFVDFGPDIMTALPNMLINPMKTIGALFTPSEKIWSWMVTLGSVGLLAFVTPEILIAAAPLILERFLASKSTMWEMGYHYAAPLTLYAAWATAVGWPRLKSLAGWWADRAEVPRGPVLLAVHILAVGMLTNHVGYRHPSNLFQWKADYFAPADARQTMQRGIDFMDAKGRDARVAAQNSLLPHLADRQVIYRLAEHTKTDYVVLAIGQNAWPYAPSFPASLARRFHRDSGWKLVFSEGPTAVYVRSEAAEDPEVEPTEALARAIGLAAKSPAR